MTATDPVRGHRNRTAPLLAGLAVAAASLSVGVASAQEETGAESTNPDPTAEEAFDSSALEGDAAEDSTATTEDGTTQTTESDDPEADVSADEDKQAAKRKRRQLNLTLEAASPKKIFWLGTQPAVFRYRFNGASKADLVIQVRKKKDGPDPVVRRYVREERNKGQKYKVRWGGRRDDGRALKRGKFYFQVREQGGRRLARSNAKGTRSLRMYPAKFPVRGPHQYWDGWGAGRGHQGQDIGADCGTPMISAEPGTVAYKGYNAGGWGYYIVINTRKSSRALLYSHLRKQAKPASGAKVKTGQRIGLVGESGNASGCHLHFEYWKGGWPNGSPSPVATKRLKRWDKWS